MLQIFNALLRGQQHIYTETQVEKGFSNLDEMRDFQIPEPVCIYDKGKLKEHAFIVKRGDFIEHTWSNNLELSKSFHDTRQEVILTRGQSDSGAYFRSVTSNLKRAGFRTKQKTITIVRNLPTRDPKRISHQLFKAIEVEFIYE